MLSLFLAHTVPQVVPQKAGRHGAHHRLRSAFAGAAVLLWALLWEGQCLCAQEGTQVAEPRKWGVHFRAAEPGIWSIAARAQGRRHALQGGGWQGYVQCDRGGMVQARFQQWVVLDGQTTLGSGVALNTLGIASLLLSVGFQNGAAHISIPLRQPSASPFQSKWQWSAAFPIIQATRGVADLQWHPGSLPLLSLTAIAQKWTAGVGSTGVWLSFGQPVLGGSSGVEWRLTAGVLRGDIPWTGLDVGSVTARGSDPAQQWHLQWLWP